MNSQEERQRLKEEYKAHYRQMLEQKKKLGQQQRLAQLVQQVREIDAAPVLARVQQSLGSLQEQLAKAEARLQVYLEDENAGPEPSEQAAAEAEAFSRKQAARDLIQSIRREMNEHAKPAFSEGLQDAGTSASAGQTLRDDPARNNPKVHKTIGLQKPDSAPGPGASSAS
ncbi:MAG: hypothetical protein ACOC2C_04620 [Cyclonatronaceae bacterium]